MTRSSPTHGEQNTHDLPNDNHAGHDDINSQSGSDDESYQPQHRRFSLQRDLRKRLDKYLCDRFPGLSRSRLQKLINQGFVTVNQRQPKSSTVLRIGDVIDVTAPPPTITNVPPENIPIDILYEDQHLIVINKHADFVVHPARSNTNGTLVNALAWHFKDIQANGLEALTKVGIDEFRPGIVHRLDKDTTGCIVVAKTEDTQYKLARQFEQRNVQKYYLAIVHGQMRPPGDVIDCPIGRHPSVKEAYAVRHDSHGKESVTIYRVREIFDGYSLVELELKTGRTHQIRVHLTWLGHPIVGDIIYGGEAIGQPEIDSPPQPAGAQPLLTFARQKPEGVKIWDRISQRNDLIIARPALHAAVLQFTHPATNEIMTFTSPLHDDMSLLIKTLRQRRPKSGPLKAEGAIIKLDEIL